MTYQYALISKRTYPYETLHLQSCGSVTRSYRAQYLSEEQVGRLDMRHDKCSKCMPRVLDADGLPDGYHPGHLEFFRIQRAYQARQATAAQTTRLARQVVALRLALAKVEAEAAEFPGVDEFIPEYTRTMADGTFTPDELDVTVGRASITKRPSYSY
jgi:hypothetical protein